MGLSKGHFAPFASIFYRLQDFQQCLINGGLKKQKINRRLPQSVWVFTERGEKDETKRDRMRLTAALPRHLSQENSECDCAHKQRLLPSCEEPAPVFSRRHKTFVRPPCERERPPLPTNRHSNKLQT